MTLSVGVLMDPISDIKVVKDTTLAMLLEAMRRGHDLRYFEQGDLALREGVPWVRSAPLQVRDDPQNWFTLGEPRWHDLRELNVVLMRKDPPVDAQFVYDTMVLELAQMGGALVVNDPRALRDANEKLFSLHFPQCTPPSLMTRSSGAGYRAAGAASLRRNQANHGDQPASIDGGESNPRPCRIQ